MHLFLSPHYDDAVYACGGSIHKLTQSGAEVIIFTLMAGEPPDPLPVSPIVQEVHARWGAGHNPVQVRRAEDQQAAQQVGARTLYNELPDCIYRTSGTMPLYATTEALFGPVHMDDPALLRLRALGLAFGGVSKLYAPLSIGHHVDHQIVRDWALLLRQQHPHLALTFYADYPYTRNPAATQTALDFFAGALPLQAHQEVLSEADMQAKIAGMQAYGTQISTFWQDAEDLARDVRAAFSENGQYIERFWQVVSPT